MGPSFATSLSDHFSKHFPIPCSITCLRQSHTKNRSVTRLGPIIFPIIFRSHVPSYLCDNPILKTARLHSLVRSFCRSLSDPMFHHICATLCFPSRHPVSLTAMLVFPTASQLRIRNRLHTTILDTLPYVIGTPLSWTSREAYMVVTPLPHNSRGA